VDHLGDCAGSLLDWEDQACLVLVENKLSGTSSSSSSSSTVTSLMSHGHPVYSSSSTMASSTLGCSIIILF
jgi:hypothetical protein